MVIFVIFDSRKAETNAVDSMIQNASKYMYVNLIKSKEALTMFCLIMMTCKVDLQLSDNAYKFLHFGR